PPPTYPISLHDALPICAVPLGPPVSVPPGVHEHGLAPHVMAPEQRIVEPAPGARRRADHDAVQVSHGFERIVPDVLGAIVPMERRVDIRPAVGEHVDLPDLKRR